MRIGFIELGRVIHVGTQRDSHINNNAWRIWSEFMRRYPEVTWVAAGRTKGELPEHVFDPWNGVDARTYESRQATAESVAGYLDGLIVYVNQVMSVSCLHVPKLNGDGTVTPLQVAQRGAAYGIQLINHWQDIDTRCEPVYMVSDPRSTLRCRDLKWPPRMPILCQAEFTEEHRHYRWGDPRLPGDCEYAATPTEDGHWMAMHRYVYSGLELEELGDGRWYSQRL
jgi:hypothetical protein